MGDWASTGKVNVMTKKRYTSEEIIQHLRMVELETCKGLAALDACRLLDLTEQTQYRQMPPAHESIQLAGCSLTR